MFRLLQLINPPDLTNTNSVVSINPINPVYLLQCITNNNPIIITGTCNSINNGSIVTVVINQKYYYGNVELDNWLVAVPLEDVVEWSLFEIVTAIVVKADISYSHTVILPSNYPISTKGDIFTYSSKPDRLSLGSNGQALIVDNQQSTGLRWGSIDYNSLINKPRENYLTYSSPKNSDYTITQADHGLWIPCRQNDVVITLPSNLLNGTQVFIDRQGTHAVTFNTSNCSIVGNSSSILQQYGVVHASYNLGQNYWRLTGNL